MRFEGKSAPLFFCFLWFYRFPDIFLFYWFYSETDRTPLQVYIYLVSILFLLQVQRKHQQPDNQSRYRVQTKRYDFTTERLCIFHAFWLVHLHTCAGMIPLFRQSAMNSEMITLHYRHVKVWMMVKRKSNDEYFQHSGSPLNFIISQKRYCFQQSKGLKKSKLFRTLGPNHTWACGGHCCSWITIKSYHPHFIC